MPMLIIVLTEAARSKEDIEAAEEQLQKFPKRTDVSFYLASANLLFNTGDIVGGRQRAPAGARCQSQFVCLRTWRWEICI